MAINTAPIYSGLGDNQWITGITSANNTADITSGTSYLICTADATTGGYVREVRIKSNPANNTAGTVVRIWQNNGSATGTASNSCFFTEATIAATTASASAALPDYVVPINFALSPGHKLYLTI